MGAIKELSINNNHLIMYNIPEYADLILLLKTTFYWDP